MKVSDIDGNVVLNKFKNNLFNFTDMAMRELEKISFTSAGHGEFLCEILQGVQMQEIKNIIINIPPAHSKTFSVVSLMAFILGHDPNCRIIFISSNEKLAIHTTRVVKKLLLSKPYQCIFPDLSLDKKGDTFMSVAGHRGYIEAKGLQSNITGQSADLIILDDPIDVSASIHDVKKAQSLISNSILNRLRPGKNKDNYGFILVNQRTGENDVTQYFVENYKIGYHLVLPFYEQEGVIYTYKNITFKRKAKTALNPALISIEKLKIKLGDFDRSDTIRRIFETQYQQNPKPAEGQLMKLSHFIYYTQEALNNTTFTKIFLTIDTATKTKTYNDYSVICCWGAVGTKLCLLDMMRGKWEFSDLSNTFLTFYHKWRNGLNGRGVGVSKILIEDASAGTQLIQSFKKMFPSYLIVPLKRNSDKFTRYTSIARYIETGCVCLPSQDVVIDGVSNTKRDITDIFLNECIYFTANNTHKHDDIVDNLIDASAEVFLQQNSWLNSITTKY